MDSRTVPRITSVSDCSVNRAALSVVRSVYRYKGDGRRRGRNRVISRRLRYRRSILQFPGTSAPSVSHSAGQSLNEFVASLPAYEIPREFSIGKRTDDRAIESNRARHGKRDGGKRGSFRTKVEERTKRKRVGRLKVVSTGNARRPELSRRASYGQRISLLSSAIFAAALPEIPGKYTIPRKA